jgi:hypothetical protein
MTEKRHVARLAAGHSATRPFQVGIAVTRGKGETIGDSIFGGGGYCGGPSLNIGSPPGAKWTGAGTNASSPNSRSSPRTATSVVSRKWLDSVWLVV